MQYEEIRKEYEEIRQTLREIAQEFQQLTQESRQRAQEFQQLTQESRQRAQEAEQRAQEAEQRFQRIEQQREKDAQEARQRAKEAEQRFQRIEQQREKDAQEAEQRSKKIDAEFEAIQQLIKQNAEEAKQRSRETDLKIQKLSDIFTNHWGRLVEALVEPGSIKLFQDRGINVTKSKPRRARSRNGKHMEIDLLLKNKADKIAVVIEVKTTPTPEDVHKFLAKFDTFVEFFPKYKGYTIYGAIAGIQIDQSVTTFAYRRGLFVLTLGNEGLVRMLNDQKFTPTTF